MNKAQFSKFIYEFISVSFAVLLALILNQCREDHNNNKLADQAIYNIKEEFLENQELVLELITNHKLVLNKLDSIAQLDTEKANSSAEDVIESLDISLINSSAWEMTKVTNTAFNVNFKDISNLAKVYKFQAYYESVVKQYILSTSVANQHNSEIDEIENARKFLDTIIPMEENLLEYYKIILDNILNKYNQE